MKRSVQSPLWTGRNWMAEQSRLTKLVPRKTADSTVAAAWAATVESAVFLGTSFVNLDCSAIQFLPVQSGDCTLRFIVDAHLDKPKTPGSSGVTVGDNTHTLNGSVWFKQRSNGFFGRPKAEVSYENVFHFSFLLKFAEQRIGAGSDRAVRPDYAKDAKISGLANYALSVTRFGVLQRSNRVLDLPRERRIGMPLQEHRRPYRDLHPARMRPSRRPVKNPLQPLQPDWHDKQVQMRCDHPDAGTERVQLSGIRAVTFRKDQLRPALLRQFAHIANGLPRSGLALRNREGIEEERGRNAADH